MKTVLFIAGGTWQRPFVQYLKDKGYRLVIVNPLVTATTALADVHIKTDVCDLDEIISAAKDINIDFVTSDQSDISTMSVARLSERLGLPGNPVSVIEKFTDKFEIYKFARSLQIPVPDSMLVESVADLHEFATWHGFPFIIKPTDSTMSRGFRKIDFEEQLTAETLECAIRFSSSGQVIAQDFAPGKMITLEGVCSGGKHRTIATSIKNDYFKPGITSGVRYPTTIQGVLLDKIIAANDHYVESSGMLFGLTHSEFIILGDKFWLIETGARGGGAGITNKIVPWVSGINTYDILHESLLGNVVDVKALKPLARSALLQYYQAADVYGCEGEKSDIISKLPGVAEFQYNFLGKQYVSDQNDTRHSMGIYLGETPEEVDAIGREVLKIANPNSTHQYHTPG
jgi:biotin carboxylase